MSLRRRAYLVEASGREFRKTGPSPLKYNRAANVDRIVLCDKSVTEPPKKSDTYFAHIERWRKFSKRGKRLKKPVLDEVIPGVNDNCIVAFLDYHQRGSGYYYLDYMKTRIDMRRKGYASAIVDHFYKTHKNASVIHWGKMMQKEIGALFEKMKKRYPKVSTIGSVYY